MHINQLLIASGVVFALGTLVLWWARACWRGTLPQNWILGFRTRLTLRDPAAWKAVHRALAPCVAVAGVGLLLGALGGVLLALLGARNAAPVFLGSSVIWLFAWLLIGLVPAIRAERAYKRGALKDLTLPCDLT